MVDYLIVGGGIVGLSTAWALVSQHPGANIVVLEKENGWGRHQSGHNSGVIHSGIYYQPGSLKASLARDGNLAMVEFCEANHIPYEICGKLIVAVDNQEIPALERLYERGRANGLNVERLGPEGIREVEPHVRGVAAIHVPSTGIVSYHEVCAKLAANLIYAGVHLHANTRVIKLIDEHDRVEVVTTGSTFETRFLINCAGLHSDRVARMNHVQANMKIVPFRGEYYDLREDRRHLVKNLVYPVPNPNFPFLGVHFTRTIDGRVEAGPNAVLSLKREGYSKTAFSLRDALDMAGYPGFWRLARKYGQYGIEEYVRSIFKRAFVRSLQRLVPEIQEAHLTPAPCGVRAQALKPDGTLVDDFHIVSGARSIHVCNAPSPAATASLAIGRYVAKNVLEQCRPSKPVMG